MTTDTLYHYCSTVAFHAIIESRSIRLSSLSLSNDTAEGKLVAKALGRLGARDSLNAETLERLLGMFSTIEKAFDGHGFCLSEEGDLLSQWRGYALDATGVSIGFSRRYLEWLAEQTKTDQTPFRLCQVQYDSELHDKEVMPTYAEIRRLIDEGAFSTSHLRTLLDTRTDEEFEADQMKAKGLLDKLSLTLFSLYPKLFLLKSRAFREEREWRLLSNLVYGLSAEYSFHPSGSRLVPYRPISLVGEMPEKIVEVILGPKHLTPKHVVEDFLQKSGFGEVDVRQSEATYR